MATGLSLHVGVNATEAVGINVAALEGCENDARKMLEISRSRGFIHLGDDPDKPVTGRDANYHNVLGKIHIAANDLKPGDIFLFTFAGHGTRQGEEGDMEAERRISRMKLWSCTTGYSSTPFFAAASGPLSNPACV